MSRVLIIGMDGASPELLSTWRDSLPNLSRLMVKGSAGTLQSTIPPRSVPAWYSFVTGANPAKLGVFGFSQRRPGTYDYTFANFSHCRVRPFWDWLEPETNPCAVIHVPGTFPPRQLNGVMISGWPMPLNRGSLVYTHPPALSHDIDGWLGQYFEAISPYDITRTNDALMFDERLRILAMHGEVAYKALQDHDWQLALVVLSPMDRASHQFWRYMDASHPQHNPEEAGLMGDALRRVYEATDAEVGRLVGLVGDDDYVFVVSDHGFGPCHRTLYLNEWLREQGYLVVRDEGTRAEPAATTRVIARLASPLFHLNEVSSLFRKVTRPFKRRLLSDFLRNRYVRVKQGGRVRLNHLPVDWSRTRAYCPDESSLYLNLRGRDPHGIVSPGADAVALLGEIVDSLRAIIDPLSGRALNVRVWPKEEIYNGPFLEHAPELTVAIDDYRTNVMAELGHGALFDDEPLWSGNHTPLGVLLVRGPGIIRGSKMHANIVDIAPTILHIMDAPIPTELDGNVLLNLFEPDSLVRRRAVRLENLVIYGAHGGDLSAEEQAQVERQLKGLGYIE